MSLLFSGNTGVWAESEELFLQVVPVDAVPPFLFGATASAGTKSAGTKSAGYTASLLEG